jgi:RimJ/RimL family protein N-acetyltransferase
MLLGHHDRLLYVVLASGEPIGQVRLERCGEREAEVSLSLAADWRGRGLAARVIRLGTDEAARSGFDVVHAYIKPDNDVSHRAFVRAGYVREGERLRDGIRTVHLKTSTSGRVRGEQ